MLSALECFAAGLDAASIGVRRYLHKTKLAPPWKTSRPTACCVAYVQSVRAIRARASKHAMLNRIPPQTEGACRPSPGFPGLEHALRQMPPRLPASAPMHWRAAGHKRTGGRATRELEEWGAEQGKRGRTIVGGRTNDAGLWEKQKKNVQACCATTTTAASPNINIYTPQHHHHPVSCRLPNLHPPISSPSAPL